MENQDTNNIYKLYKEGFDDVMSRRREAEREGYKDPYEYHENPSPPRSRPRRLERGGEYTLEFDEFDDEGVVVNLVKNGTPIDEYRARSSERPAEAKVAAKNYFEQEYGISIDDGYEENAEEKFPGPRGGKSDNLTDLVAHSEHIADDLAEMGYEDDELVGFVETYIQAAIETVLDNPEWFRGEENAEDAKDYGNTFPGAPDVKIPWEQTPNQKRWSELHHRLRALANSNRPGRREEELEIIAQLQRIVDTDPKFKNEYVSKPML